MTRKARRKFNKEFIKALKKYDPTHRGKHILHINCGVGDLCRDLSLNRMTTIGVTQNEGDYKSALNISLRKGFGRGHPAFFYKSYLDFLDENMTPPEQVREQLHKGYDGFNYILSFRDVDMEPANLFFLSRYCGTLIMKTRYPEEVVFESNFSNFIGFMDGVFLFHKLPMPTIEIIK